jgi:hypothetical protein
MPKIKAELIFEKKGGVEVTSSKQQTNKWICRCNDTNRLAQETGKAALLGKMPQAAYPLQSTAHYLDDIYDVAKAKEMVLNLPSASAQSFLQHNIIDATLKDSKRRSVIVLDGEEVDLRTTSSNRSRNNGLTTMQSPVSISVTYDSSTSSKHKPSENEDAKIKMMKRRAAKYMHATKRPSVMSIEEKSERAAAIKVNKLYCAIIEENKSKEEVDAIKDALDDDEAFCSQKYNECFMNIFGYPDE